MTKLSVNINKIATIRNARGGQTPNVVQFAIDCQAFGADGITVHPRPDERHITYKDTLEIAEVINTEFNIEGYPDARYFELLRKTRPAQATLVPDGPSVLTSNAGWDVKGNRSQLDRWIQEIKGLGIRCSLFMEPNHEQIELAATLGADRIEFYTGPYAEQYASNPDCIKPYVDACAFALKCGLAINAGHDLSRENLRYFKEHMPRLDEVSIGHALISDALYFGIENTIHLYKRCLD
ncbi:MAG: pyridoxine 5'-phosphate synthase [Flavobacteriales bacterium]